MESFKYGYVYITENVVNNKKYIGQKKCNFFNETYLGSGKHLKNAIKKYGKENFKVKLLEWCQDSYDLNLAEIFHIWYNKAVESNEYYNMIPGGNDYSVIYSAMSKQERVNWLKNKSLKGAKTAKNTILDNGLSIRENAIIKKIKTVQNTIQENGLTIQENASLKLKINLRKIEKNGKTNAQNRAEKAAISRKQNNKKLTKLELYKKHCFNKGKKYWNNGKINYLGYDNPNIIKEYEGPWKKGKLQKTVDNKQNKGKHWWNNGQKSILSYKNPNNAKWKRGRL